MTRDKEVPFGGTGGGDKKRKKKKKSVERARNKCPYRSPSYTSECRLIKTWVEIGPLRSRWYLARLSRTNNTYSTKTTSRTLELHVIINNLMDWLMNRHLFFYINQIEYESLRFTKLLWTNAFLICIFFFQALVI